ncbi:hypothetical protein DFP72DRAFT_860967 [Ephemerocybe angulata]|uniref:Uncharacterized protein n=1 Tax=Ephemerocybe angulata TaxID=980116 RepID=A0A8H6LTJ1_9AGAR|nr:hypothetical protein DFP72DRAFT_860967 [Tulosesus angulatus]
MLAFPTPEKTRLLQQWLAEHAEVVAERQREELRHQEEKATKDSEDDEPTESELAAEEERAIRWTNTVAELHSQVPMPRRTNDFGMYISSSSEDCDESDADKNSDDSDHEGSNSESDGNSANDSSMEVDSPRENIEAGKESEPSAEVYVYSRSQPLTTASQIRTSKISAAPSQLIQQHKIGFLTSSAISGLYLWLVQASVVLRRLRILFCAGLQRQVLVYYEGSQSWTAAIKVCFFLPALMAPRHKSNSVEDWHAAALQEEKQREASRASSRRHYYKNLVASRAKGASKARSRRASKGKTGIQRQGKTQLSDADRLERQREASRKSSFKNYHKDIVRSREKGAARARKMRELKKKQMSVAPALATPPREGHAGRLEMAKKRCPALAIPAKVAPPLPSPVRTQFNWQSPPIRNFRELDEMSSSSRSSEGTTTSLPFATPSPPPPTRTFGLQQLPMLPPGPFHAEERNLLKEPLSLDQRKFVSAVWLSAMGSMILGWARVAGTLLGRRLIGSSRGYGMDRKGEPRLIISKYYKPCLQFESPGCPVVVEAWVAG